MSITLLVTGFGPFPGAPFNPTGPLALRLARLHRPAFAETRRIAHVFPTSYAAIDREFPPLISRYRPDAVLMFGLATRTRHLRIELRARNTTSMVFADAERRKSTTLKLAADGPTSMRVRAPYPRMLQAARATGVPAALSHDAGRYICNALFWRALEVGARRKGPAVVAFVHVPRLRASLSLGDLVRAGEAIMLAVLAAAHRPR
jgi:pyroglutamyl-peptidase